MINMFEKNNVAEKDEIVCPVMRGEISVDCLLEKMESMQAYIDKLEQENAEYKRAMVQLRELAGCDRENDTEIPHDYEDMQGHELLGAHGRILVIGGQELGTNVMHGIAKSMGFQKKDFEFVDYDKAKDYTDRVRRNGKYCAVIFGACPHKTAAGAGYSSILEKFRQVDGMPYATDARSKSGKLKVTKESFRNALSDVCENLRVAYAC